MINEELAKNKMQTTDCLQKITLQKDSKVKIDYSGDVYLVAEAELTKMEGLIAKIPLLEAENEAVKKEISEVKGKLRKCTKMYKEKVEETTKLEQEIVKRDNQIQEQAQKIMQLEQTLQALNDEYAKLKSFKANQGRGRQNVLNPQQVAHIRTLALQGKSTAEIHRMAQGSGIDVSRETIRKIVKQVTGE